MRADTKDLVGGGALTLTGLYMFYAATGYRIGTPQQMGPGYFPMIVSGLLIVLGVLIASLALTRSGTIDKPEWRPLIAISASVLVFALSVRTIGLVPAVFAATVAAAMGHRGLRPVPTLALGIGLAVGTWILFVKLLGLTMPALLWPILIL